MESFNIARDCVKRITKEEMIKLAKTSHIAIDLNEIAPVAEQLGEVLSYAIRVQEIAADTVLTLQANTNIFRADIIEQCNPGPLLRQAPERADNFFVVPSIIETV